jgi:hypothetical protein
MSVFNPINWPMMIRDYWYGPGISPTKFSYTVTPIATILQLVAKFLHVRDIGNCEGVSKVWNASFNEPQIWYNLFIKQGISFVEGHDHSMYKNDFKTLYPMFISGAKISRFFGEVVRGPPDIRQELFNELEELDPFEKRELKKDAFVFVVIPSLIKRIAGDGTPLDLDAEGNLIELPLDQVQDGKELLIPFTPTNFTILCSYPLEGKGNMPVFENRSLVNEIWNACHAFAHSTSSKETSVHFMRRCAVIKWGKKTTSAQACVAEDDMAFAHDYGVTYSDQVRTACKMGFAVTNAHIRCLFNAVQILELGTCSDILATNVRCPDVVRKVDKTTFLVSIYGFAPRVGMRICSCRYDYVGDINANYYTSIVPGILASTVNQKASSTSV